MTTEEIVVKALDEAKISAWLYSHSYLEPVVRCLSNAIDDERKKCIELMTACEMVLERWSFTNNQQHTHTWHDMQDCRQIIIAAIAKVKE